MNIKATFQYAYQKKETVTIIDTWHDRTGELWVIYVGTDGMIRRGLAEFFEVIDGTILPTEYCI